MTDNESVQNEIEFISGSNNILLVAPHGHHLDDENTGTLTRLVAEQNGCYAIINEVYRKPKKPNNHVTADKQNKRVNLNRQNQVKTHLKKEFLEPLIKYKDEIVEQFGNVFLLWIHGADDASVRDDIKEEASVSPEEIKVLFGYGQDADETQQRHTAQIEKVQKFIDRFNQAGLNAIPANDTIRKKNADKENVDKQKSFCAWDIHNMNQFFRVGEYHDPNVESTQLEFRMADCRDTDVNIENTARMLAQAISPPVSIEDPVAQKAYEKIALIFSQNYEQALMEVGQYIVRTFYGGENDIENKPYDENFEYAATAIENARNNDSPLNDSLHRLYAKISDEKTRNTPSQAWVYNAVRLVIQWHDVKKELKNSFYTYRNLLLSHKISLLTVKDIQEKLALIQEVSKKDFTALSFKKRIADSFAKKKNPPPLSTLLKKPEEIVKDDFLNDIFLPALKTKRRNALTSMKTIAEEQSQQVEDEIKDLEESIKRQKQYLKGYNKVKSKIEKAIESKDKTKKKKSAKAKPKSEKSDSPSP